MNSYTHKNLSVEQHRSRLETLINRSDSYITAYHPGQLRRLLSHWGQTLVCWLTNGTMPRISKTVQGDTTVWKAYDPISHQTHYFHQENALRIWLEERYYQ
ncbi:MAG: hypothetical protein AAF892_15355 [Cyanobacteria bacterium P01_D01_bin.71]